MSRKKKQQYVYFFFRKVEIAKPAKNMGNTAINGNIGDVFVNFKDFQHALGIAYYNLGDFRKAIEIGRASCRERV